MLYALLLGVAFHHLSKNALTLPGIEFCSRSLLRLGVGLLGARITASQIAGLRWTTAAIVVLAVVSTLLLGYAAMVLYPLITRLVNLPPELAGLF